MAGFVSRLVACLVAVVAVLQLVHLVLLNKLESTRLHELRRLQQQQQYQNVQKQQDQNLFVQETDPLLSDNANQSPHHSADNNGGGGGNTRFQGSGGYQQHFQSSWSNWRSERSTGGVGGAGALSPAEVPEQEIRFDHLLREDQGAIVDATGEYRIVFDVAGPHTSISSGSASSGGIQQAAGPAAVIDKDAIIPGTNNAQTDDFSIDDENFDGLAPPLDVTLVTHGTYQDIQQSLIPLVSRWNGPMSVAIFCGNVLEMQLVLEFISQARLCHGPTKQYVSFHLVETHSSRRSSGGTNGSSRFEKWRSKQDANLQQQKKRLTQQNSSIHTNSITNKLPIDVMTIGKSCQGFREQINKYYQQSSSSYSSRKSGGHSHSSTFSSAAAAATTAYKAGGGGGGGGGGSIPVNLLRNVARRRVQTEYSLVTNIKMMPSRDLRTSFQQFARDRMAANGGVGDDKKTVFVVPAFEIKADEQIPQVKNQLLELVDRHKGRPYEFDLCWKCQMYTDYETWQKDQSSKKSNKLGILFEVLWKDPWEPFFISTNEVPLFDERFRCTSVSRTSQLCELHVAGYAVLNNALLVHRSYAVKNQEEKSRDVDTSRAHFRQFKIELKGKYPHSTRRCY